MVYINIFTISIEFRVLYKGNNILIITKDNYSLYSILIIKLKFL